MSISFSLLSDTDPFASVRAAKRKANSVNQEDVTCFLEAIGKFMKVRLAFI